MKCHHIFAILLLAAGLVLSVLALMACEPLCDRIERDRLEAASISHMKSIQQEVDDLLALTQDCAKELHEAGQVTHEEFSRITEQLWSRPEFDSIEFAGRIPPDQRDEFEARMEEAGLTPRIMGMRPGSIHRIHKDEVVYPIAMVRPMNSKTESHIGLQRPHWSSIHHAAKHGRAFLTGKKRFFSKKHQFGIVAPTGTTRPVPGFLIASLKQPFSNRVLELEKTVAHVRDITSRDFRPAKTAASSFDVVDSNHVSLTGQQQLGGRLFEVKFSQTTNANFRPTWIPWIVFVTCSCVCSLFTLLWCHRTSSNLIQQNERLHSEIERRTSANRNLQRLLDQREQERDYIAQEIHDGFIQDIVGAQMYAESTCHMIPEENEELKLQAVTIGRILSEAIDRARQTINHLKPSVVDEIGLVAAIENLAETQLKKFNFEIRLSTPADFPRLPILIERQLFHVIREGASNARQHSGEDSVSVELYLEDDRIVTVIADTGLGFNLQDIPSDRFGLTSLQQRAETLKGRFVINSSDFGTKLRFEVPQDCEVKDNSVFPNDSRFSDIWQPLELT